MTQDSAEITTSILRRSRSILYRCRMDAEYTMLFITGATEELTGYAPELAEEWRRSGELSQGSYDAIADINLGAAILLFFTSFVGPALMFGWLIASWPVYSRLNNFGRWRTVASFVLGLLAVWIVGLIGLVILDGLFPDGMRGVV